MLIIDTNITCIHVYRSYVYISYVYNYIIFYIYIYKSTFTCIGFPWLANSCSPFFWAVTWNSSGDSRWVDSPWLQDLYIHSFQDMSMPRAVVIQDHLVENDGNHVLQKMPGISICRKGNMFLKCFSFFIAIFSLVELVIWCYEWISIYIYWR